MRSTCLADDRFDRLICSEVLEHIPDYQGALTEIWRVVKPGGKMVFPCRIAGPSKFAGCFPKNITTPGRPCADFPRPDLRADFEAWLHLSRQAFETRAAQPYWWLRCAVGVNNDKNLLVRGYKKLLEVEILKTRCRCARCRRWPTR